MELGCDFELFCHPAMQMQSIPTKARFSAMKICVSIDYLQSQGCLDLFDNISKRLKFKVTNWNTGNNLNSVNIFHIITCMLDLPVSNIAKQMKVFVSYKPTLSCQRRTNFTWKRNENKETSMDPRHGDTNLDS